MAESLEGERWYHGLRPKEDVIPLLKEVGDWLVRAVESHMPVVEERNEFKIDIVLSVVIESPSKVFNYLLHLNKATNMWAIASMKQLREFATPLELIKHYQEHNLPGGYRLLRPICRPAWMLSHSSVQYDESDLLGQGHFCYVVKGKYRDPCKEATVDVAIKVWNDEKESTKRKREEARDYMLKEAKLMMRYKHQNIVQFYGAACDRPPIMIVMEFCPGGDLEGHLRKMRDGITRGERIVYCLEIARGVRYLHNKNCIHGDLACRNCLIAKHGEIKITDFGLSKLIDEIAAHATRLRPRDQLPVRWMAPETLTRVPLFSTKSDVWSYGMIFNNGEKPWPYLEAKLIAKSYKNGKVPRVPITTPLPIAKLMIRTWHLKAEHRPDFGEIIVALNKALCAFPPPSLQEFTVYTIEGVIRRTPEEEKEYNDAEVRSSSSVSSITSATSITSSSTVESVEMGSATVAASRRRQKVLGMKSSSDDKINMDRPRVSTCLENTTATNVGVRRRPNLNRSESELIRSKNSKSARNKGRLRTSKVRLRTIECNVMVPSTTNIQPTGSKPVFAKIAPQKPRTFLSQDSNSLESPKAIARRRHTTLFHQ